MLQDLALALRLQALDRKIAGLESEIAVLPRQLAEIEKQLESNTRKLEQDRAALQANGRDRKTLEGDIQTASTKISKLRDQTLQAKNNEQYRAFQNEIGYLEGEIRKCEDRILELMEASEPLEKTVAASELALTERRAHVETEKTRVRSVTARNRKELDEKSSERRQIAAEMNPKVQADYERIRKKTKNRPIAEVTDGRCDGCQISLRPQFFQDLRKGDKIMTCESCGRILIYNPVVEFSEV